MSKGPCSHKETWWWNEEVAEAVREKKKSVEIGKKKNRQACTLNGKDAMDRSRWEEADKGWLMIGIGVSG